MKPHSRCAIAPPYSSVAKVCWSTPDGSRRACAVTCRRRRGGGGGERWRRRRAVAEAEEVAEAARLARRPENHRDPEGGVDANVKECSSGESRLVQPRVERRLELEAERCADADDLAYGALRHRLADSPRDREEPRPHALHQEEVALPRRGDALGDLRCRHGERLLAQHVPASPKAEDTLSL